MANEADLSEKHEQGSQEQRHFQQQHSSPSPAPRQSQRRDINVPVVHSDETSVPVPRSQHHPPTAMVHGHHRKRSRIEDPETIAEIQGYSEGVLKAIERILTVVKYQEESFRRWSRRANIFKLSLDEDAQGVFDDWIKDGEEYRANIEHHLDTVLKLCRKDS